MRRGRDAFGPGFIGVVLVLFLSATFVVSGQEAGPSDASINYNQYYRFPFSFGVDYANFFPTTELDASYRITNVGGNLRWPIPGLPLVQPELLGGATLFDSRDAAQPDRWDHTHGFAAAGLAVSHRLGKVLELGGRLYGGYSLATFPNVRTGESLTSPSLVAGAGLHIGLSPFFNFTIDLRPGLRYYRSQSALTKYDGVYWGVGASLNLRLGSDPDGGRELIRDIRFGEPQIEPLFAAMQSYYAENPVGSVTITNTADHALEAVEVSFFQRGFMDGPTPAALFEELGAGESREVAFPAVFNDEVFQIEGVTPLTGELTVAYQSRGRAAEQQTSVTYDLHDKTALTWDDDRKMGAFITPADSAIRNFASQIQAAGSEDEVGAVSEELQFAMQAYHAMGVRGMFYQPDPTSPFTQVQENTFMVDSVSLPRDTVVRQAGDCDDLTALYATILETVGVETAFVTTPGHIFVGVNTTVPAAEHGKVHPDPGMVMLVDGETWVLVEITLLGEGDFMEAWTTGMREFQAYRDDPEQRGFYETREAQQVYRPVGLRATERRIDLNQAEEMRARFVEDRDRLAGILLSEFRSRAEERGRGRDWQRYGIMAARFEQFAAAERAFTQAGTSPGGSPVEAQINIGSMYYLQEQYADALAAFTRAQELVNAAVDRGERVPRRTEVTLLLNLSKAHYELEQFEEAQSVYEQASRVDAGLAREYSYLAQVSSEGQARAAESGADILFLGDE